MYNSFSCSIVPAPKLSQFAMLLKFFYGDNLNFYSQLKPYLLNFFETSKIFRNKIRKNNLLVDSQGLVLPARKRKNFLVGRQTAYWWEGRKISRGK